MKKIILLLIFILVLNISFSYALINETKQVNEAYKWLENNITRSGWPKETLEHEAVLLALNYHESLKNAGLAKLKQKGYPSNNPYCWGKEDVTNENQCKIKETAIASFIYNKFGLNYSKINKWLLNNSKIFTDIYWFIQIDIARNYSANCSVIYDGSTQNFTINKDKTITFLQPQRPCLSVYDNYWIQISKDCYDKNFKIVCDVENNTIYKIGFLYKENLHTNKWYASDISYSINSGQYIDISVRSLSICLKNPQDQSCDYEGTAIAAYVLKLEGVEEYASLMPYLILNAQSNANLNSYAFLYLITGDKKYGEIVLKNQNPQGFWKISGFGQYYDTAVNAYSLKQNYNADYNETKTKRYLLSNQHQDKNKYYWKCDELGCRILRDTAMILYVFWPRGIETRPPENETITNACEEAGGECKRSCNLFMNEVEYSRFNYACGNFICCINALKINCDDINGEICDENEVCVNGELVTTKDSTRCCYNGSCEIPQKSCRDQGGEICDNKNEFCFGDEIAANDTDDDEVCCDEPCKTCEQGGGRICKYNEECDGTLIGGRCCIGECIPSECKNIGGEKCDGRGWICKGEIKETGDTDSCCIGDCIKTCEEEGGEICEKDEKCEGDVVEAADTKKGQVCCIGECKKKGKINIGLIILLLLIIIIGVLAYFGYKKGLFKRKPKEKPGKAEIFKVEAPPTRPITIAPTIPKTTSAAPPATLRAIPKPTPKIEIPKETIKETKKEETKKKKSKTEEELEKTLKRIRELTK